MIHGTWANGVFVYVVVVVVTFFSVPENGKPQHNLSTLEVPYLYICKYITCKTEDK